jgi:hypothetical protein
MKQKYLKITNNINTNTNNNEGLLGKEITYPGGNDEKPCLYLHATSHNPIT